MIARNVVCSIPLFFISGSSILMMILESDFDSSGAFHIDLWTGSNTQGGGQNQVDCEDNLPGGQLTIINDPPNSLPVDSMSPSLSSSYLIY